MFQFASPYLLLLLIPAAVIGFFAFRKRGSAAIKFSDVSLLRGVGRSSRIRQRRVLPVLRTLVLALLVVALARPQSGKVTTEVTAEGIDIMLALDVSGSMRAEDFKPENRLHVAKQVIKEFVQGRINDRIGLVVFSKQSFTQCPLTLDYGVLLSFLDQVHFGMIEDGTAIGMAIANSVNRLRDSKSKSRIIVLLTDGINNAGEIDQLTAAEIAKAFGIKIYTVGAGKPGRVPYPVDDPFFGKRYRWLEVQLDEKTLTEVAELTGGQYFRARSEQMLEKIFNHISELEKTKIKVKEYLQYREFFPYLLLAAGALLLLELFLRETRFRQLP